MVRRFSDTTSPTKEGLSQSGGIVSNPHNSYRGLDESRAATYEFVASLSMVRPATQLVL
jgi:hypothetical protein